MTLMLFLLAVVGLGGLFLAWTWGNPTEFRERAERVRRWLAARNWWKAGCLAFGGLFAMAAFYADERRREVIVVTAECDGKRLACETLLDDQRRRHPEDFAR